MMPVSKTFSTRTLQRDYRSVIDEAKRSQEAVVLVTNSAPEAVLLDIETYNALVRDEYVWDEAFVKRQVAAARKSYRAGKAKELFSWDDLDA